MRIIDCEQGSPMWYQVRAGIPTSSQFSRIITPARGDRSKSWDDYVYELIAERIMGHSKDLADDQFQSVWMRRGSALEREARAYYQLVHDCDITLVGFVTNDAGTAGASPDALVVGTNGGLEVKCPKESVQVRYLFHKPPDEVYRPQVQGQMWIGGLDWVDTLAFHPELPKALVRAERDEEYIGKMDALVTEFVADLESRWEEWVANHPDEPVRWTRCSDALPD